MRQYYLDKVNVFSKKLLFLAFLGTISFASFSQNVNVTATSGTATGSYLTLSAAFANINNGTHQGTITISIVNDIAEPAGPTALLAAIAPSAYTSVTIVPVGNRTITGSPSANRSIIELFGADNVTINGDDPATAGIQNLSILVPTGNFTQTAAVRIGSVTATNGSTDVTIKNCIIKGGRPSNIHITNNFGIIIGSNNVANILTAGVSNKNITIENNDISRCLYGIASFGTAGSEFTNINILRNKIGISADFVGRYGIVMSLSSLSTSGNTSLIEGNEVQVGTNTTTGMAIDCIGIFATVGNSGLIIRRNNIHDIINNTTSNNTGTPHGLPMTTITTTNANVTGIQLIGTPNDGVEISNNFVRDVISARKQTSLGLDANYGIYLLSFGTGVKVNHNTVALIAPNSQGTTTNAVSAAVLLNGGTTGQVSEYLNNIVVNRNNSTNAFCIVTTNTTIANAAMNKNCYHFPNGSCGNSGAPFTLANWQIVTGKDQQSFIENPPFVSNTDVHLLNTKVTQLESNSFSSTYNIDIDGDIRPGPAGSVNGGAILPDIGADEVDDIVFVAPVLLAVNHSPTTQSCAAQARTVNAIFSTLGNGLDSVMLEYSINGGSKIFVKMTQVSALGFTRVIPSAFPSNAIISYRVFCVTSVGDTLTSNYFYYNDNTGSSGLVPTIVSTPNQACANSIVSLSYSYLPDPTGFNFPPTVTTPTTSTDITNVKLININNTSALNSLTGTLGNATGTAGAYSNFRNLAVDSFSLGKSYPVSISSTTTGSTRTYFSAFADFNGDGDFNDAGENVFNTLQVRTIGSRTENFSLYIPPNARPGKTCLRVFCSNSPILNAFSNIAFGEIEDYSIYIRPLNIKWMTGATVIGSNNPQAFTVTSIPSAVYVELADSTSPTPCTQQSNPINITASPSTMNVSINAPARGCYNTPILVTTTVTGGCPPYTYAWSNGAPNASAQVVTLTGDDSLFLTVTVTDKNGMSMSSTDTILPNNPKPTFVPDTQVICNRGTTRFTVNTLSTDSAYWYSSATASPYSYDSVGRSFTTPIISSSRNYYVSAFRSNLDSVGKLNLTGTTVAGVILNSGLRLTIQEPVLIRSCAMYIAGPATSTINIGLLDKYGSIIAQTGSFTPTFAANATTPTIIPLNFLVTTPDTGLRLVLLDAVGLTTLNRNSTGQSFPYPATKPIIVTGPFSLLAPTSGDYFYFYNIKVLKNMCVGQKRSVHAKVRPPVVPALNVDLKYTLVCKGDSLRLKISTDTFGNRFVWTKNDNILQDKSTTPPSDTTKDSFYRVAITGPSDTGLYRVRIFSTKFCTRDTFSREVRVSFLPEPKITQSLAVTNLCIGTNRLLSVNAENGYKYQWFKSGVPVSISLGVGQYSITNASITNDTGVYRVFVTDSNNCRTDSSIISRVNVYPQPQITTQPLDTVLCENNRYVITAKASNATNYQWFKDNGIMNFFTKDSLILYNALLSDSGSYRLIASSYPGCTDAITNIAKITVNPVPKILGFYPSSVKFCEGQKIKLVANTKDVLNVQWYKDNNPTSFLTSDSFVQNPGLLTAAGKYYFRAKALNKCPDKISDTTTLTVVKKPLVSGFLPNITLCSGNEFKGGFSTTNVNQYQWYRNNIPLQGYTDSLLYIRFLGVRDTGRYTVKVNNDSVCTEVSSNGFRISVQPAPEIDVQPVGDTACLGENIPLVVMARNANGFQWKKDNANIASAINNTYIVTNLSAAKQGKYFVTVGGIAPCTAITSDTAYVVHRSGQTNATATLVSLYNAEEQCTDVNDWTYYAPSDDPTKYIFAVKKNGNTMIGKADVVVRPSAYQNVNNSGSEYSAMIMLQRFWNYKIVSGDFINPIDVKFYYNKKEEDDLKLKQLEIANLYNTQLKLENTKIRWFKTDSLPFTNTRLNDILGNTFRFPTVDLTDYTESIENNVNYIEFKNVKNIGGGTGIFTFKGSPRVITGIQDANAPFSSNIYPNPNNGEFNLQVLTKSLGTLNIMIVNQLGQTVYSEEMKLNALTSDKKIVTPTLSNGIYQLIMTKDDYSSAIKLQIEK